MTMAFDSTTLKLVPGEHGTCLLLII